MVREDDRGHRRGALRQPAEPRRGLPEPQLLRLADGVLVCLRDQRLIGRQDRRAPNVRQTCTFLVDSHTQ